MHDLERSIILMHAECGNANFVQLTGTAILAKLPCSSAFFSALKPERKRRHCQIHDGSPGAEGLCGSFGKGHSDIHWLPCIDQWQAANGTPCWTHHIHRSRKSQGARLESTGLGSKPKRLGKGSSIMCVATLLRLELGAVSLGRPLEKVLA
jgi:hypothetical protein